MLINDNISKLSEFEMEFLLKNGKRSSVLNNFDFESITLFSFKFVKKIMPNLLKLGNFDELIFEAFKDRGNNIFKVDVNYFEFKEVLYFIFWLKDELELWSSNEQKYLSSDPNIKMISAGINKLDIFGINNIIDSLAKGDITKYNEIESLPYGVVFDKQWKSNVEDDIQKKLMKNE